MTSENDKPEFPCKFCDKVCKNAQALKMHVRHKHSDEFVELYPGAKPAKAKDTGKPEPEVKDEGDETPQGESFLKWLLDIDF